MLLLITADQRRACEFGACLERLSYAVDFAKDLHEAHTLSGENPYEAWVHYVDEGSESIYRACQDIEQVRQSVAAPLLVVSEAKILHQRVALFEAGADQLLIDPFAPEELDARLRVLIKRARSEVAMQKLCVGSVELDMKTGIVHVASKRTHLSPISTRLLAALMRASPRFVPRSTLMHELWGFDGPSSDSLRSHVYNLRRQLHSAEAQVLIENVAREGYRAVEHRSEAIASP